MQRRAAAVYFAVFMLLAAGAYAFIQVGMSQPHVELDGPTYSEGDEFQVGDRTYNVSSLEAESGGGGGGHGGGGGGVAHVGELTSGNQTVEFEDGDNVTLADQEYFVHFESNNSVQILSTDEYYADYSGQQAEIENWEQRKTALWAIVFLLFVGGGILFMSALMPVRG